MGEIKQTNFRIDASTAETFRQFCDENGYNQAQGFDHLVQVLELSRAKAGITGRLTEITTFEEYVKKIMEAYLNSLQIAQDTEERVREDFKTDLSLRERALAESEQKVSEKDQIIATLKTETADARKLAADAVQRVENAEKQSESAKQIVEETKRLNNMLTAKLAEAEEKLVGYDALRDCVETLKQQNAEMERAAKTQEAAFTRDLEEQKRTSARDLEEQARANAQALELAVERAISKTEKAMLEQIALLRDEKVRLQVQIEMLQKNK